MVLLFYAVNGTRTDFARIEHDERTRDLNPDNNEDAKKIFKAIAENTEYRAYDMSQRRMSPTCVAGYADFQDEYNDEELDGGWWVAVLNLTSDDIYNILH